jgi:hypothetical protein
MRSVPQLIAQIEAAYKQIESKENIEFNKAIMRQSCIDLFHTIESLGLEKGQYPIPGLRLDSLIMEEPTTEVQATAIIEPVSETIIETVAEPIIEEQAPEVQENIVQDLPESIIVEASHPVKETTTETPVPLVEKLNKAKEAAVNVVDKQKETPIADLSKAISISKKFEFINALFDGQAELYKNSIQTIQTAKSYDDATQYIEANISGQFNWNEQEKLAAEFFSLVRRRFL